MPASHHRRATRDAIDATIREQRAAVGYHRSQREAIRRGRGAAGDRTRPLLYDESGYPLAEKGPSLIGRVARLLSRP